MGEWGEGERSQRLPGVRRNSPVRTGANLSAAEAHRCARTATELFVTDKM